MQDYEIYGLHNASSACSLLMTQPELQALDSARQRRKTECSITGLPKAVKQHQFPRASSQIESETHITVYNSLQLIPLQQHKCG